MKSRKSLHVVSVRVALNICLHAPLPLFDGTSPERGGACLEPWFPLVRHCQTVVCPLDDVLNGKPDHSFCGLDSIWRTIWPDSGLGQSDDTQTFPYCIQWFIDLLSETRPLAPPPCHCFLKNIISQGWRNYSGGTMTSLYANRVLCLSCKKTATPCMHPRSPSGER